MKTITANLSADIHTLEIHVFADFHIGDPLCDMKHIRERIEAVRNNPNARFIINGDIMNNATRDGVSDVYGERMTPMQELTTSVELFKPIAEKCLAITEGNHEARTYKSSGLHLLQITADELNLSEKYSPTSAIIFVRFGRNSRRFSENRKMCYSIFATHGAGGGRNTGAKANRLEALNTIIDADVYVRSHTHEPIVFKTDYYRTCTENNSVQKVDSLFVNTSAEMEYGGYGEVAEYTPASIQNPIIYLSGSHRELHGTI